MSEGNGVQKAAMVADHTFLVPGLMLAAALEYAAQGLCVLPVVSQDKRAIISDWPENASSNPEQVEKWWRQWPLANVGVLTGKRSGIVVIDVDDKNDRAGSKSLAELEAKHGKLPPTRKVITGGGFHLYFRYPEGRTIPGRIGYLPGLDVKSDRGYVVAPPSVHESKRIYAFEAGTEGLGFADLPTGLLGDLAGVLGVVRPTPNELARLYPPYDGGPVLEGTRHRVLFTELKHAIWAKLSPASILALAEGINSQCNPPLTAEELQQEIKGAYDAVAKRPTPAGAAGVPTSICSLFPLKGGEQEQNTIEAPLFPYREQSGTNLNWLQTIEKTEETSPLIVPEKLADFLAAADKLPEPQWLIRELIPAQGSILIVAAPNVGKTWLGLILSKVGADNGRRVIWIEEEGSRKGTAARVRILEISPAADIEFIFRTGFRLDNPSKFEWLARYIRPNDIVVLDPLSLMFGGNESSTEDRSWHIQILNALMRQAPEMLLVILHHTGKGGNDNALYITRGSTVINDWVDNQLNLKTTEDSPGVIAFDIHVPKMREFEKPSDRRCRIDINARTWELSDAVADSIRAEIIAAIRKHGAMKVSSLRTIGGIKRRYSDIHHTAEDMVSEGLLNRSVKKLLSLTEKGEEL